MSFSNGDIAQLFLALALLLVAAHVLGWACARLGQPRVADDGQQLPRHRVAATGARASTKLAADEGGERSA